MAEQDQHLTEAVTGLIKSITPERMGLFRTWVNLPNSPDIMPEVTRLVMVGGDALEEIDNRIEATRKCLGVDYNLLQQAILRSPLMQEKLPE